MVILVMIIIKIMENIAVMAVIAVMVDTVVDMDNLGMDMVSIQVFKLTLSIGLHRSSSNNKLHSSARYDNYKGNS